MTARPNKQRYVNCGRRERNLAPDGAARRSVNLPAASGRAECNRGARLLQTVLKLLVCLRRKGSRQVLRLFRQIASEDHRGTWGGEGALLKKLVEVLANADQEPGASDGMRAELFGGADRLMRRTPSPLFRRGYSFP